ncbi:hypothetical protein [Pedobacter gandavensis]|uniref:hypothetical protein n=1 Tax=Pedobacter gandavensis TaxID=2679963 RepID=UPI0029304C70|nr:hypothetical protein [Pedobacter gandavensis]
MRGVVSLATALSIPVHLADGSPFPQRNLILFITFIVILLTLLIQGLTLPYFIRKIKFPNLDKELPEEESYQSIKKELAAYALSELRANYPEQLNHQPMLQQIAIKWENATTASPDQPLAEECKIIYLELLEKQRIWLINKNKIEMTLDEEIIRRHLKFLDMEEEKFNT